MIFIVYFFSLFLLLNDETSETREEDFLKFLFYYLNDENEIKLISDQLIEIYKNFNNDKYKKILMILIYILMK
jgi:hypothetical protein